MRLYELAEEYRRVIDAIEESDGELSPTLEADLDAIEGPFEAKIESCCALVDEFERDEEAAKKAADRLKKREVAFGNRAKRIRKYVQDCMERAGVKKVSRPGFSAWIQANNASAKWTGDPDAIPPEFMRWETSIKFDATSAIESWKAGEKLPEGVVVGQGTHLRIK
ncbi:siphovirus Gp157 family protein [Singulisphaera sp. Ch08]|uniref:Siphovirus Gp157 family protein n=1 Tax=Singulisphaera sp. Ch08 TaxID=3120278 RepID=A0AAU7CKB5_9BACT